MFVLVLLNRDGTFHGTRRLSSYYAFLLNRSKDRYCYKLYEEDAYGNLNCIKEKL